MTCPYCNGARMALERAKESLDDGDIAEAQRHVERATWYAGRHEVVRQQMEFFAREREGIAA